MRTTCVPPFSEWEGSSCVGDSYQCSVHGVSIVHHNICPRLQHLQWGVRKIPSFCAESQRKSFHAWRTLSFLTAFDSPQAVHPGLQLQNFHTISKCQNQHWNPKGSDHFPRWLPICHALRRSLCRPQNAIFTAKGGCSQPDPEGCKFHQISAVESSQSKSRKKIKDTDTKETVQVRCLGTSLSTVQQWTTLLLSDFVIQMLSQWHLRH